MGLCAESAYLGLYTWRRTWEDARRAARRVCARGAARVGGAPAARGSLGLTPPPFQVSRSP